MNLGAAVWRLMDYAAGRTECSAPPTHWMVETTNRCNLTCPMCTRRDGSHPPHDMDYDFFRALLDANPAVECIWPHGFGEPLMHPFIFAFIRFAKALGKTVSLSTNISLLDRKCGEALVDSGLDYLVMPVDGTTDSTYSSNRNPSTLKDIEARIDRFLKLKLARRSGLHVTIQMVRMCNNQTEVDDFRRKWKRPGVNAVRVRDDLSGLPGIRIKGPRARPGAARPCFFLWRGPLCVQSRGTIIPCPYYHGSVPYGDLNLQSVSDAWNSSAMQALRNAHLQGNLSNHPVCARCPRHQPHPILAAASFFVSTHQIRKVLPRIEDLQRKLQWKLVE